MTQTKENLIKTYATVHDLLNRAIAAVDKVNLILMHMENANPHLCTDISTAEDDLRRARHINNTDRAMIHK